MKKVSPVKNTRVIGAALTAAAMLLPSARPAMADAAPEKSIIAFKYLNYKDWQPDGDRMNIKATSMRVMTPIAGKWALDFTGTIDSVGGASPHCYTVSAASVNHDVRKAGDLSVTRYLSSGTLTAGTSWSVENDYSSKSVSLQGGLSTPSKNTTVTLGGSYTSDNINPTNHSYGFYTEHKKTYAMIVGLTQIMSKNDIVQFNLGRSVGVGYFSDPYKINDKRPRHRNYTTIMGRWNHYFEPTEGVLKLSYRYYTDTYGIKSHTLGSEYMQPLPNGFSVTPSVRYYSQSTANFYIPTDSPDSITPDVVYTTFSEDQRLSAFGAVTLGLKVSKHISDGWLVDARYDRYMQRGDWGINGKGDPGLDKFDASFVQLGIAKEF
jgi:hypothetical protein